MENNLAENIRAFRKARKMTQEQLAEALGMTVGTIHKWERNLSTPEIGLIMDMAELFGVSTDVLLGYEWRSESFTCVLERIKALTQAKRYEEAASEAEKALKKFPNHFELVYSGAMAYMNMSSGFDTKNGAVSITPAQTGVSCCQSGTGRFSPWIRRPFPVSTSAEKMVFGCKCRYMVTSPSWGLVNALMALISAVISSPCTSVMPTFRLSPDWQTRVIKIFRLSISAPVMRCTSIVLIECVQTSA